MNYRVNLKNDESPAHKHQNYEIHIYIKGKGMLNFDSRVITLNPGKIIVVPPGVTHTTTPLEDEFERIYIQGDFDQIFSVSSPIVISDNVKQEGMQLATMIYNNRFSNSEYVAALINAFVHFLLQSIKTDNEINVAIQKIINKITNEFYDPNLNICTFLNESGYAEDYIRAHFKNTTGKTPIEFLTKVRINHACFLIDIYKKSLSLSEIALKCGYNDYVYFSRRFKQVTNMSPREYMAL